MADSKSGPRSENGDWTGYFVSGQEAVSYGAGFLLLAARLRAGQTEWVKHAAETLEEWGNRFLSAEEGTSQRDGITRYIEKHIK